MLLSEEPGKSSPSRASQRGLKIEKNLLPGDLNALDRIISRIKDRTRKSHCSDGGRAKGAQKKGSTVSPGALD